MEKRQTIGRFLPGSRRGRLFLAAFFYAAAIGIPLWYYVRDYMLQIPFRFGERDWQYYLVWILLSCAIALSFREPAAMRIGYAAIFAFAGIVIFGYMRFARIDEGAHLDYICYVARSHRLPTMFQNRETELLLETGVNNVLYPDFRYEAVQTPLYYVLMAIPAALIRNMRVLLYFGRCAGLAMWAAAMVLARRILGMLRQYGVLRNEPSAVLFLHLFGISPGILVRCIFISNEPLAILLSVIIMYYTVRALEEGPSRGTVCGVLLSSIAIFYTKSTGVFLIGGMLLVLLYYRKIAVFFGMAAAYALSAVPWFARNLRLYGTVTGMNEHIRIVIDRINPEREQFNLLRLTATIFERKYFIPAEVDTQTALTDMVNKGLSFILILIILFFVLRELRRLAFYVLHGWKFRYDTSEKAEYLLMISAALIFANITMLALSTRSTMLNTLIGRYLYYLVLPMSILFSDLADRTRARRAVIPAAALILSLFWIDTAVFFTAEIGAQHFGMTEETTGEAVLTEDTDITGGYTL